MAKRALAIPNLNFFASGHTNKKVGATPLIMDSNGNTVFKEAMLVSGKGWVLKALGQKFCLGKFFSRKSLLNNSL